MQDHRHNNVNASHSLTEGELGEQHDRKQPAIQAFEQMDQEQDRKHPPRPPRRGAPYRGGKRPVRAWARGESRRGSRSIAALRCQDRSPESAARGARLLQPAGLEGAFLLRISSVRDLRDGRESPRSDPGLTPLSQANADRTPGVSSRPEGRSPRFGSRPTGAAKVSGGLLTPLGLPAFTATKAAIRKQAQTSWTLRNRPTSSPGSPILAPSNCSRRDAHLTRDPQGRRAEMAIRPRIRPSMSSSIWSVALRTSQRR